MKYLKKITLKDGSECVIRNANEKDGKAAFEIFNKTHEETDFLLSYPEENSFNVEEEGEFLQKKTDSENEIELIAEVDGKGVALAGIESLGSKYKIRHRAEFGISVLKDYEGLGIGRAMTEACIECAKNAGYVQLELDVVADNARALSLYKSVGFTEYGRNPLGFNSRESGFQELLLMRLELKG